MGATEHPYRIFVLTAAAIIALAAAWYWLGRKHDPRRSPSPRGDDPSGIHQDALPRVADGGPRLVPQVGDGAPTVREYGTPDANALWDFSALCRFPPADRTIGCTLEPILRSLRHDENRQGLTEEPSIAGMYLVPSAVSEPLFVRLRFWFERKDHDLVGRQLASVPWNKGIQFRVFRHVRNCKFADISTDPIRVERLGQWPLPYDGSSAGDGTLSIRQNERLELLVAVHGTRQLLTDGAILGIEAYIDEAALSESKSGGISRSKPLLFRLDRESRDSPELLQERQEFEIMGARNDQDGLIRIARAWADRYPQSRAALRTLAKLMARKGQYKEAAGLAWQAMRLLQEGTFSNPDPITGDTLAAQDVPRWLSVYEKDWKWYEDRAAGRPLPPEHNDDTEDE